MRLMVDRHQAVRNALGSAHLEGADPGPEVVAAMRAWADDPTSTPEQLGELAKRAAAGLPLTADSSLEAA
jgi:hypothetical protein